LIFHEPFGAAQRPPRLVETEFFGVQVQVELISPEEGRLARVLSTDPQVFLDPRFQPGRALNIRWEPVDIDRPAPPRRQDGRPVLESGSSGIG
ncbi:MAG: YlzJ-like family protein, partial [Firmicutes bacterium]|nr:YlzJ-like family protein [Bacillota bacterium]